jgi:toxin FitB
MIYLLDTNIVSEVIKKSPNDKVVKWLQSVDPIHLALSVLTLGEIRKGAEKLEDSIKKQVIIQWLEVELPQAFLGRIINVNHKVADKWGYISSNIIPAIDGLIAATALTNNLKLVTRNVKDFQNVAGLEIINPWEF